MLDDLVEILPEAPAALGHTRWATHGGVTLANLSDYLVVGVDVISTGTLSHSYRSLDIGLDFTSGGH